MRATRESPSVSSSVCPRPRVLDLRLMPLREPLPSQSAWRITDADDAVLIARSLVGERANEHLVAIYLSPGGCINAVSERFTSGSTVGVIVEPTAIIRGAILANAIGLVTAHSHPGSPRPSCEDHQFWRLLAQYAEAVGIESIDDVVIGPDEYYTRSLDQIRRYRR
ncbi:MAG: JAB domain-containing protein [Pseudomonadota bacterium]